MEREQHTVVLEGATLTMGEELFQPSETTEAIVGCCRDLYIQSLEVFVFALLFSGKVGVYQRITGVVDQQKGSMPARGLTEGFDERLRLFGDLPGKTVVVADLVRNSPTVIAPGIQTINETFGQFSTKWEQHLIREVWMYARAEAKRKGIEMSEAQLENDLASSVELEQMLSPNYVLKMRSAVCAGIGDRSPANDVLDSFIRKNTVAHIAAHRAYKAALQLRDDLGEVRSLMPHPTRQTLIRGSLQSLIEFVVPAMLYEVVVLGRVRKAEELRRRLGEYTTNPRIIEAQRILAHALVESEEARTRLLAELTNATREFTVVGNVNFTIDPGIRLLALMRAQYNRAALGYDEGLNMIFPGLKRPSPAESGA
jgi:hypothetical protein